MVIAAENVADLILHEALKETPLAMLTCTVAGYRRIGDLVDTQHYTTISMHMSYIYVYMSYTHK